MDITNSNTNSSLGTVIPNANGVTVAVGSGIPHPTPLLPTSTLDEDEKRTLRLLVQHVARKFYDVDQVVILDQLAKHDVLKDEDLAGRIGTNAKDTAKRLGKLMSTRLVLSHTQNEQKDPASNRSSIRRYYYIDYPLFCNLVKFGIADMHRVIDEKLRNELADKGYICPNCKKTFAMLDAYQLADPFRGGLFFCDVCGTEVVDNTEGVGMGEGGGAAGREDRMQRFNKGTEIIQGLLKKTDEIKFPSFDIAQWVHAHTVAAHMAANAPSNGAGGTVGTSASGKPGDGLAIAGAHGTGAPHTQKVSVEIIDEKGSEERRKALEAAAMATRQQNALPAWHTHSTVSGDVTALGLKEEPEPESSGLSSLITMDDEEDQDVKPTFGTKNEGDRADYYARYYAQLEEKRLQEEEGTNEASDGWFSSSNRDETSKKRPREDEDEGATQIEAPQRDDQGKSGVIVYVAGQSMDLNDVTDEHHDLMTPEEYEAYFQLLTTQ